MSAIGKKFAINVSSTRETALAESAGNGKMYFPTDYHSMVFNGQEYDFTSDFLNSGRYSYETAKNQWSVMGQNQVLFLTAYNVGNPYIVFSGNECKWLFGAGVSTKAVNSGDIIVIVKNSLLNVPILDNGPHAFVIPTQDAKAPNGDFPGTDGLETVWDKTQVNKIPNLESRLGSVEGTAGDAKWRADHSLFLHGGDAIDANSEPAPGCFIASANSPDSTKEWYIQNSPHKFFYDGNGAKEWGDFVQTATRIDDPSIQYYRKVSWNEKANAFSSVLIPWTQLKLGSGGSDDTTTLPQGYITIEVEENQIVFNNNDMNTEIVSFDDFLRYFGMYSVYVVDGLTVSLMSSFDIENNTITYEKDSEPWKITLTLDANDGDTITGFTNEKVDPGLPVVHLYRFPTSDTQVDEETAEFMYGFNSDIFNEMVNGRMAVVYGGGNGFTVFVGSTSNVVYYKRIISDSSYELFKISKPGSAYIISKTTKTF